ncbi:hypothetical protein MMC34_007968 [Xylographa carneopallida]|nr:hypothetical protein [Xylographa carneopallida]
MASSNPSSLPTILFVPGAWHSPGHYSAFLSGLNSVGYPTICERNPSCNSASPEANSTASDASAIRTLILAQLDAGHDLIVAMHSYGGCPGAAAAHGLSKHERQAAGQPGGVIGLVFICAFVAREGESLIGNLPGAKPVDWMILHPDGNFFPANPKAVFYADVPSPADSIAISQLRLQSAASLGSPSPPPAWADAVFDGRRGYVICTEDQAIPAAVQKMMVQGSGVDWAVRTMRAAHSPFLSDPKQLRDLVVGLVQEFERTGRDGKGK